MSIYMAGMNGFNLGIVGGVAVLAIILGTIWGALKFLMGLITHLADDVPQWIGGRGQRLGEKEQAIQGAQSGSDKAKGVALGAYGVGRAVAGDVGRKMASNRAKADKDKNAQNDQSATVPGTTPQNIGAGETAGKTEGDGGGSDLPEDSE